MDSVHRACQQSLHPENGNLSAVNINNNKKRVEGKLKIEIKEMQRLKDIFCMKCRLNRAFLN